MLTETQIDEITALVKSKMAKLRTELDAMKAENERLRSAIKNAVSELSGQNDGTTKTSSMHVIAFLNKILIMNIKKVLELHAAWLLGGEGGVRANLSGANLGGANLHWANLSGADLSGANLPPVRQVDNLKLSILSAINAEGCALKMDRWHTCNTVHCLAGWAVTLHPEGQELENKFGTNVAGAIIFNACCGEVPDFYATNEAALEWLKKETK